MTSMHGMQNGTHLSGRRSRLSDDGIQCCWLAGAVRAKQAEDFTSVHREAAVDDSHLRISSSVAGVTTALQSEALWPATTILLVQVLNHQQCRLQHRHAHTAQLRSGNYETSTTTKNDIGPPYSLGNIYMARMSHAATDAHHLPLHSFSAAAHCCCHARCCVSCPSDWQTDTTPLNTLTAYAEHVTIHFQALYQDNSGELVPKKHPFTHILPLWLSYIFN